MTKEAEIVAQAEHMIAALHEKQKIASLRAVELADERGRIALSVHGDGDPKARVRLDKINAEISVLASEQASIESAIIAANARANVARAGEALAADRAQALQLREKSARFKELGIDLDGACADVALLLNEMIDVLDEIHACGQAAPTSEQFRINASAAIKTVIQSLPQHWVRDFEFQRLAPNQKKSFSALVEGWTSMIESSVVARIGEKQKEVA
jgi:hypothetical protein